MASCKTIKHVFISNRNKINSINKHVDKLNSREFQLIKANLRREKTGKKTSKARELNKISKKVEVLLNKKSKLHVSALRARIKMCERKCKTRSVGFCKELEKNPYWFRQRL